VQAASNRTVTLLELAATLLQAFRQSGMGNQPHLPDDTNKNNQPIAQPRQHASRLNITVRLNKQQALIEVQSS